MNGWGSETAIALFGALGGAIVGAVIALGGESWNHRRDRKSRATYLANRVVIAIDSFVAGCADSLGSAPHPLDQEVDPATFAPFPGRYHEPEGIDWTAIDDGLAFNLLGITTRDLAIRAQVRGLAEYDPYAAKELRDELFAQLALEVLGYADRLRVMHDLPGRSVGRSGRVEWLQSLASRSAAPGRE